MFTGGDMTKDEALELAIKQFYAFDFVMKRSESTEKAIAAIKQALALDKKAENARELGLDYEPVQQPFCFYYVENGEEYFAPKGAYVPDNAQPLYTTPPAQPALVQEPVRWSDYEPDGRRYPAVPDAFGTREGEHPQYIEGWNDCRAEMLKGMKP